MITKPTRRKALVSESHWRRPLHVLPPVAFLSAQSAKGYSWLTLMVAADGEP